MNRIEWVRCENGDYVGRIDGAPAYAVLRQSGRYSAKHTASGVRIVSRVSLGTAKQECESMETRRDVPVPCETAQDDNPSLLPLCPDCRCPMDRGDYGAAFCPSCPTPGRVWLSCADCGQGAGHAPNYRCEDCRQAPVVETCPLCPDCGGPLETVTDDVPPAPSNYLVCPRCCMEGSDCDDSVPLSLAPTCPVEVYTGPDRTYSGEADPCTIVGGESDYAKNGPPIESPPAVSPVAPLPAVLPDAISDPGTEESMGADGCPHDAPCVCNGPAPIDRERIERAAETHGPAILSRLRAVRIPQYMVCGNRKKGPKQSAPLRPVSEKEGMKPILPTNGRKVRTAQAIESPKRPTKKSNSPVTPPAKGKKEKVMTAATVESPAKQSKKAPAPVRAKGAPVPLPKKGSKGNDNTPPAGKKGGKAPVASAPPAKGKGSKPPAAQPAPKERRPARVDGKSKRVRLFEFLLAHPGANNSQIRAALDTDTIAAVCRDECMSATPRMRVCISPDPDTVRGKCFELTAAGKKALAKGTVDSEKPDPTAWRE